LAVEKVLDSGWVAGGEKAAEFAQRVADIEGYRYGVATNSCTSALVAALEAYPFGHDVINVPNITFPATINAVILAGYEPRIVSNWDRMGTDLGVDLFGLRGKYRWSWNIADAACSIGSKSPGNEDSPDVSCYSFHPRKLVTTGEGGAACTDNEVLYERMRDFVNHGGPGFGVAHNMRMSDINAAIGLVQLDHLDNILDMRHTAASWYNDLLPECVDVWGQENREVNADYNYQTFTIIMPDGYPAVSIRNQLADLGVESTCGTQRLDTLDAYRGFVDPFAVFDDPNFLSLPIRYDITYDEVAEVCEALGEVMD
jgi:dTDP-4-amino-4,6-dideoxygalactose transaminase